MCGSQICKGLVAAFNEHEVATLRCKDESAVEPWSPSPAHVAHCARMALNNVVMACGGDATCHARRLALCVAIIEREALPQAGRWHRRDLVPAAAVSVCLA